MLIAVALTLSRGGFVAVAVSLVALLLVLASRRNYRIPALFLLAALGWAGYYFAGHSQDLDHRFKEFSATSGFDDARMHIWPAAWQMWLDHAWFGVGPGHFDDRFARYRPGWLQSRPQYAHNDYLNALADWGAVGAGLLALVFILFYWGVAKTWPFVHRTGNALQAKKSNKPAIVLGGAAAILAMLVHAVTEFNLQIPANALLAVSWLAVVSSYLRFATEGYWVALRGTGKLIATFVMFSAFLFLASQGVRRAEASLPLRQGDRQTSLTNQISLLKQALAVEPKDEEISYSLAEKLRQISFQGNDGYQKPAREAMTWFEYGMSLNPWDPRNYTGYGQCLDWIGQPRRATPYFDRAIGLDPNNAFLQYRRGKHAVELEEYRDARRWLGRALLLDPWFLPSAAKTDYFKTLPQRIQEAESRSAAPAPPGK
jgi:tetratricopeptide (TPR) repeat protein